jgi:hypothetical protein
MNQLDAALEYAARGWPVLPCVARGKRPHTGHGLHDASTDRDQIRAWWARWPSSNIGLRTGIVHDVLDVDPEGLATLAGLGGADRAVIERGAVVGTPRGGVHVWYLPTGLGNKAGFKAGLDWRGRGGYALVPPSVGANDRAYEWVREFDAPLPAVPRWLLDLVDPPRPPASPPRPIVAGSRYAAAAFDREVAAVKYAPEGTRNNQLFRSAAALGNFVGAGLLNEGDVAEQLTNAAAAAGLAAIETKLTITSGLERGKANPRQVAS